MGNEIENNPEKTPGWLAPAGTLTGLFSVVGASCCILPIILVNIGVSSALVSYLGVFALMRPVFIGLTFLLIAAGFFYAYRGGRRPTRRSLALLIFITVLALVAIILPSYEGRVQTWLHLT